MQSACQTLDAHRALSTKVIAPNYLLPVNISVEWWEVSGLAGNVGT